MFDDDVYVCKIFYVEKGEFGRVKDKDKIIWIIFLFYEMVSFMDIYFFGFILWILFVMYNEMSFFFFLKMIIGCSYGIIYNKNIWWNEELRFKEDFWISCYMKYKEWCVFIDFRYNFEQKNIFVNVGGLVFICNQEEEWWFIFFIKKNFGDSILLKSVINNGKDKIKQFV